MEVYEYLLDLEPENCYPEVRDVMRVQGKLKIIKTN